MGKVIWILSLFPLFLPLLRASWPAHWRSPTEEEASPHQRAAGEGHHLKSKRPNPCAYTPPSLKAVQRIAESHLQSISNLGENQASEEEDELGELRELGYPREEEEEEEEDDEEEEEEEDSQAEVLKGSRGAEPGEEPQRPAHPEPGT